MNAISAACGFNFDKALESDSLASSQRVGTTRNDVHAALVDRLGRQGLAMSSGVNVELQSRVV